MQRLHSTPPLRQRVAGLLIVFFLFSTLFALFRPSLAQALDATPYLNPNLPDYGIQQAIDVAAANGGDVVQLPAGTYTLETFLQLKNGVTLQGTGANTILKAGRNEQRVFITQNYNSNASRTIKVADVSSFYVNQTVYVWRSSELKFQPSAYTITGVNATNSTITLNSAVNMPLSANVSQVSYGLYTKLTSNAVINTNTIKVADTSVFHVGEALSIKTTAGTGIGKWGVELNIVAAIDEPSKTITLKDNLTLNAPINTIVQHQYAAIVAYGNMTTNVRITDIGVKDLVIEGWNSPIKPAIYDFFLGGINFVMCDRATISNVTIRYWSSDAFSLQRCNNSTVADTTALENRGHGYHPGTGSNYIEFVRIHAINNLGYAGRGTQGDGLYYCWNNNNVNIRQSEFRGNAGSGVGDIGGAIGTNNTSGNGDVDRNLLIEDSIMEANGRAGISITGGGTNANTVIRRNVIKNNNVANMDYAGINIKADTSHAQKYTINNNWVESDSVPATQFCGIRERNGTTYLANSNTIKDNIVLNHRDCHVSLVGANSVETGTQLTAPATTPTPQPPTATIPSPTATPVGGFIEKLVLYNADTDQPIAGYDPMPNNAVINYATLGTTNISIVAIKSPATGGSVKFVLDGLEYRIESSEPYVMDGNSGYYPNMDYHPISPTLGLGTHTVQAIPYTGSGATGTQGASKSVTFTIINGVPTATATAIPTATNTPIPTATNTVVSTSTTVPTATTTVVATDTATTVPTATSVPLPTAHPVPQYTIYLPFIKR